ncbi:MAG: hypothetical protein SWH61_01650 [Thermodesulfobacteriota bacterium]|nr:hypothetical protein [Thermodesulfobacteriota bacterium]
MSGMTDKEARKDAYAKIGRMVCMLLNRSMMYQANHPHIQETIESVHETLTQILPQVSTLALLLHQDQLYLDEEPVDPRVNTSRIIALFKKAGIQSVAFFENIPLTDLQVFVDIFVSTNQYPDCDAIITALNARGVAHLKINHVFFKKVTRDDEVIDRRVMQDSGSAAGDQGGQEARQQFMEMLMESFLTDETEKSLSMKSLMADPAGLSESMLDAENKGMAAVRDGAFPGGTAAGPATGDPADSQADMAPGTMLLYQVQALSDDIEDRMENDTQVNIMAVADAVFEMKRQLAMGIEAQKALNVAYANEEQILEKVNTLSDNVIIKLIKSEYQQGAISITRLAQILRRLVPSSDELKRLLPQIKRTLLAEGMPVAEYLQLVQQLGKELENEGLSQILHDAAESAGVDGEELLAEIRQKPEQAAELIAIAAEIRKGAGDENAFTEMLIDYVEQLGDALQAESAQSGGDSDGTGSRARAVMDSLGAGLTARLKNMNFSDDVLAGMEQRINARMDDIFEKLSAGQGSPQRPAGPSITERTLLQMMEHHAGTDKHLQSILRKVRADVEAGKIGENDFEGIYAAIMQQEERLRLQTEKKQMPAGVLKAAAFKFHLEKELLRAKRHQLHLSTLAFTIVDVRPRGKVPADKKIRKSELFEAAYRRLVEIARTSDIVGELKPDTMGVFLPMAAKPDARQALNRITKQLHDDPFEVDGIPLSVIIAGAVATFNPDERPNIEAFMKTMLYELEHVAVRVRNIHNLK